MWKKQSKTLYRTWGNDFVSMPGTWFWREPSLYLCLRPWEYSRPLHIQQHDTQWDDLSSGPREVCQAQGPTYSILLKKPKCEAEIYSIWHKNTGRVYQKGILVLFTVLGLTVQCFWKCLIEHKYVKKKKKNKKAAGTADVNVWVAFFLIIIFILLKSLKSESGVSWTLSGVFPKITACQHPFHRNEPVYLHHCLVKSSLPCSTAVKIGILTEMPNPPFPYSGISLIAKV